MLVAPISIPGRKHHARKCVTRWAKTSSALLPSARTCRQQPTFVIPVLYQGTRCCCSLKNNGGDENSNARGFDHKHVRIGAVAPSQPTEDVPGSVPYREKEAKEPTQDYVVHSDDAHYKAGQLPSAMEGLNWWVSNFRSRQCRTSRMELLLLPLSDKQN